MPETDVYSTCLAVENLWLAARAEGLGLHPQDSPAPGHPSDAAAHRPGGLPVLGLPSRAPGPTNAGGCWLAPASILAGDNLL
jgi:hypothetical protein